MTFRVAVAQFEPIRENIERNISTLQQMLKGTQADLVVLPEMANTGYLYDSPAALRPWAEARDGNGPFLSAVRTVAKKTGGVIVAGYTEIDGDNLYNSAAAVSPKDVLANYQKIHLFADEKDLFQPGNTGFTTFEWQGITIGLMICFDWFFPESARSLALAGAQIIAHPANLVLPYCQDAMITRSIENRVFTLTANRIGTEGLGEKTLTFTGGSQITNPHGAVLFRAQRDKPIVHVIEIDPAIALNKNITQKNNWMDDRRPELYHLQ